MSLSELRDAVAELSDVNESAVQLLSGVADLLEEAARQEDVPEGGIEAEVLALAAEIRQQTGALAAAVAEVNLDAEPEEPVNTEEVVPEPSPGDVLAEQGVDAAIQPDAPTTETVSDETNAPQPVDADAVADGAPPQRPDVRDV